MTCHIFYLTSFSMPKVNFVMFVAFLNRYFDYILSLGHIFTNICIIAYFLSYID